MTPGHRPVRVALVGYGGSARTIHEPLIRSVDGLELSAVVPTGSGAAAVAAQERGLRMLPDIGALADGGIDVAVVTTPDVAHVNDVLAALEAGVHVVAEKPLAATVADGERLAAAAAAAGLRLIPFQNRRWDGDFRTVQKLLSEDVVGRPVRFDSRLTRWSPRVGRTWRDQRREGTLDGRLADIGAHLVDQAIVLFGAVSAVYAEIRAARPSATANDDCFVALHHRDGVVSHLHMSSISSADLPRLRLQGLGGAFVVHDDDPQMPALSEGHRPGDAEWERRIAAGVGQLSGTGADGSVRLLPGDWAAVYRGVRATIAENAPVPVEVDDAVQVLRVLDAAARSARERTVVTVDDAWTK